MERPKTAVEPRSQPQQMGPPQIEEEAEPKQKRTFLKSGGGKNAMKPARPSTAADKQSLSPKP